MLIHELAKKAGVSIRTIRHYESIGLIEPAPRVGKYRQFDDEFVLRLDFIKRCKSLGFRLNEIKDFLPLAQQPENQRCHQALQFIEQKRLELVKQKQQIDQNLIQLNSLEHQINQLISER